MCGIAGAITLPDKINTGTLEKVISAIAHRGPDDQGIQRIRARESDVWLGNTRLAILDLSSAGHQPMADPETGNWIAYNGEVYNYREVRRTLEQRGVSFDSGTDTEVLLKAYRVFGRSCVEYFRGMFAFAIWDERHQELFLCRDRLGKKPLYYWQGGDGLFFFASEVRALLDSGLIARKLDPLGLEIFLINGFLVSPRTIISGIRSLLPGYWMRIGAHGEILQSARYWKLPKIAESGRQKADLDEIRDHLRDAVQLRMISDVSLGAFLSGGLDSSTVVALMKQAGGDVCTFSVTFEEKRYDESRYSRAVADQCETDHREIKLRQEEFYRLLPSAIGALDQPSFDGLNTFCVAQAARQSGLKVAVCGTGADELFGGYPFFRAAPLLFKSRALAAAVGKTGLFEAWFRRPALDGLSGISKTIDLLRHATYAKTTSAFLIAAYQTAQTLFPWRARGCFRSGPPLSPEDGVAFGLPLEFMDFILEEMGDEHNPTGLSKLALRLFLGERCLRDTDTMSMGVSLEVRAPFTDHVFVEAVCQIPGRVRCQGPPNKPFMQRLVRPLLWENYLWRKKQGFIFPFQEWLSKSEEFERMTNSNDIVNTCSETGLRQQAVTDLFHRFRSSRNTIPWSRVWAIAVLLEWCRLNRVYL